jgi:hypothetical protein
VGAILGDGCLERNGKHVRLRIDHGEVQQALVEWKFHQLAELEPSPPKRVEVFDPRTQKTYVHYRFATRTSVVLDEYYHLFYGASGIKRVPEQIGSHLNSALSIAVWYMDDGGRRGDCRSGYFNTQAFSAEEVLLLREGLQRNFQLPTTTHFAAGRPRIYIRSVHFEQFCGLIRPHVIPTMQYKLL